MKKNNISKRSVMLTVFCILLSLFLTAIVVQSAELPKNSDALLSEETPAQVSEEYGIEVSLLATDRDSGDGDIDIFPGDTAIVNISVTGGEFDGAALTFSFDDSLFEAVSEDGTWAKVADGKYSYCTSSAPAVKHESGVIGTFIVKALPCAQQTVSEFTVDGENAYVVPDWTDEWNGNEDYAVPAANVTNCNVTVMLRSMTVTVSEYTDLFYKAEPQELLMPGYTAIDNASHDNVTDVSISYCVLTKAQIDSGALPADYSSGIPSVTDAGEYRVYYKAEKTGYNPFISYVSVSIQKRNAIVEWFAEGFNSGKLPGNTLGDFWTVYNDGEVFDYPVAKYVAVDNTTKNATVTLTSHPGASFSKVGVYTFTVDIGDNYNVNNPTCTVVIDGAVIEGYTLENTETGSLCWNDGKDHAVATLVKVPGATEGVSVEYSLDGGNTWSDEVPTAKAEGVYSLTAKLSKTGYYDKFLTYQLKIRSCIYEVEKADYVTGRNIVLVYTNDDVPGFTYDGILMYDVTSLGYRFGAIYDTHGERLLNEGREYSHVFACLVSGNANLTLVMTSNKTAHSLIGNPSSRYDVNGSNSVDINDLVAVQAVYNVNNSYFGNENAMSVILSADVSGDKKVDMYDAALVKSAKDIIN